MRDVVSSVRNSGRDMPRSQAAYSQVMAYNGPVDVGILMAEETPVMARLIKAAAAQRRANDQLDRLVVEAMDAGENQAEIARIIGRSREHLRTIRRRVKGQ